MPYKLTRTAANDLRQIYRYGAATFGPDQASAYHALLAQTFVTLAAHPLIARERLEITPPVRIHPSGAHLIACRIESDASILILRVRQSHEDWLSDPL